ncbi:hypothetical protein B0H14DRAFT_3706232 [Mycena olivaceomarginata]|nr:hypothetical protein B0H14DRAFT_3706232 [Mycena olivaceomarginata]
MRNFTQELIDEILDHVADKILRRTGPGHRGFPPNEWLGQMGALGLVCKQWWPRTRLHLFSYLTLRPATIQAFFGLVDASRLPILTFVETLDLRFDQGPRLLDDAQLIRFRQSYKLTDLWIRLPRMEHSDTDIQEFCSSLQSHASILGDYLSVVSAFPALQALDLSGLEIIATGTVPTPRPLPPNLRTLRFQVQGEGADAFFGYLLSLQSSPALETMELDARHTEPNGAVALYFRNSGGTIQHLVLDGVRQLQPGVASCAQLAIRYSPNLRSLYIIGEVTPMLGFISEVSSGILGNLRIYQVMLADEVVSNPWGDVDLVLAESRFSALTYFKVYATHIEILEELSPAHHQLDFTSSPEVRAAMPLATSRGIMACSPFG